MSRAGLVHPHHDAQLIRIGGHDGAIIAIPARSHGIGNGAGLQIIHALPDVNQDGETIRERVLKLKLKARNEFIIFQVFIVFLMVFGSKLLKRHDPKESKFVVADESHIGIQELEGSNSID